LRENAPSSPFSITASGRFFALSPLFLDASNTPDDGPDVELNPSASLGEKIAGAGPVALFVRRFRRDGGASPSPIWSPVIRLRPASGHRAGVAFRVGLFDESFV
jgi:hypothetical protein